MRWWTTKRIEILHATRRRYEERRPMNTSSLRVVSVHHKSVWIDVRVRNLIRWGATQKYGPRLWMGGEEALNLHVAQPLTNHASCLGGGVVGDDHPSVIDRDHLIKLANVDQLDTLRRNLLVELEQKRRRAVAHRFKAIAILQ